MGGVIVRYQWTLPEQQEAHRWHHRQLRFRRVRPLILYVFAGLLLCMQGFLFLQRGTLEHPWTIALSIYLVVLASLIPWLRRWAVRRNYAKSANRDTEITWEITAASLRSATANSASEVKWAAFNKALLTPVGLLLYPQPNLFYWLPQKAFETKEGFEAVIVWARQQIVAFREIR